MRSPVQSRLPLHSRIHPRLDGGDESFWLISFVSVVLISPDSERGKGLTDQNRRFWSPNPPNLLRWSLSFT